MSATTLRNKQGGHRAVITKLEREVNDLIVAQSTDLLYLNSVVVKLIDKRAVMKELHESIIDTVAENLGNVETEMLEFDLWDSKIDSMVSKIYAYTGFQTPTTPAAHTTDIKPRVHMPKLILPKFDGSNLLEWQGFWDAFTSAVHLNTQIPDVNKFNYLKAQLTGTALDSISGFTVTGDNYGCAVALLTKRFGRPYLLGNAYYRALLNLPKPDCKVSSIRQYHDSIQTYVRSLSNLGKDSSLYGEILVPVILDQLPVAFVDNITRSFNKEEWTFASLLDHVGQELRLLESRGCINLSPLFQSEESISTFMSSERPVSDYKTASSRFCAYCEKDHRSVNCKKFPSVEARKNVIMKKRLCRNCLRKGHQVKDCPSQSRCRSCKGFHHTSICDSDSGQSQSINGSSSSPDNNSGQTQSISGSSSSADKNSGQTQSGTVVSLPPKNVSSQHYVNSSHIVTTSVLETAVASVRAAGGDANVSVDANVLFDTGSQRSFITRKLADQIQFKSLRRETVSVNTFGSEPADYVCDFGTVYILSLDGELVPIDVLVVPEISAPMRTPTTRDVIKGSFQSLVPFARQVTSAQFSIHMLIGVDFYWSVVLGDVIRGDRPGLVALRTKLGYVLSGPVTSDNNNNKPSIAQLFVNSDTRDQAELKKNVETFWSLESLGIEHPKTVKSREFEVDQYISEIQYDGNQYTAKLPWRSDFPTLPTNYNLCIARTRSTIRKLAKTGHLKTYGDIIAEQERRRFISRVPEERLNVTPCHYLCHHAVFRDSATTPLRIVYDCSCKSSASAPSLNDCLLSGPALHNNIVSIMLQFRLGEIGIVSDAEKAFLQIKLDSADRDFTRFLWLRDPEDPESDLICYQFDVVIFGAKSSPMVLNATILKHLSDNPSAVSDIIKSNIYVDNVVASTSKSESIAFYKESRELMAKGHFNLRSFSSNDAEVMKLADSEGVAEKKPVVSVLGLKWDTVSDSLLFKPVHIVPVTDYVTKRQIVKSTATFYDSMGYLVPVSILAKILIQDVWKLGIDWDDHVLSEIYDRWRVISEDLELASKFEFSRKLFDNTPAGGSVYQLHIFADSSSVSYGCCAYLVVNGQSTLCLAKSRVAPLKPLTIPKLELLAAVIASRLLSTIRETLRGKNIDPEVYLWSDSQIVLSWIASEKTLLDRFVQNRVLEIRELTIGCSWNYCKSSENPADILSRGSDYITLSSNDLWWHGPRWLRDGKWPSVVSPLPIPSSDIAVMRVNVESMSYVHDMIDVDRFSSLPDLLRITATIRRCADIWLKRKRRTQLTYMRWATREWIKSCQFRAYSDELNRLHNKLPGNSRMKHLSMFLDNGIIKSSGRIHNSNLEDYTKFPPVLPPGYTFTELIVMDAHISVHHEGLPVTMTKVRQSYWVPRLRQFAKNILSHCYLCLKGQGPPYVYPPPPPLPEERVKDAPPFAVTGIDYAGPFEFLAVINPVSVAKSYIVLFTCAVTRCIHLELVTDLSLPTFMLSFRRFCSRRSCPSCCISDNASTFQSAEKQLKELFASPELERQLADKGCEWKFIPRRGPWFGGFYERLIGLTKRALKKTLNRSKLGFTELQTVVTEIECTLNDRPLTALFDGIADPVPITPSQLFMGRNVSKLPYRNVDPDELNDPDYIQHSDVVIRAKKRASLYTDFQRRWREEYLTALRERHGVPRSASMGECPCKIGDVVLVHSDKDRSKWKLAIITNLIKGPDGLIRIASIKTSYGFTNRPINRLYPLEISCRDAGELLKLSAVNQNNPASDKVMRPATRVAAVKARELIKGQL